MLWTKGWLETRWRFLFALVLPLIALGTRYTGGLISVEDAHRFMGVMAFFSIFAGVYLAGSGIKTQSAFRATKGIHGSMYFTLSLPVSRFRLLLVRAAVGLLEAAAVNVVLMCAGWLMFPLVRESSTPADLGKLLFAGLLCTSCFYCLSILLSTFLDDMWQVWGSLTLFVLFVWLKPLPRSLDVFRALTDRSPLITHNLPWAAMAVSLGAAAILFFSSLKIVQMREY